MTAPYKKRAKGGWCGGKAHKEASNALERNFEPQDVAEQLAEETRYKAKKKPSRSNKKLLNMLRDVNFAIKFSRGDIENLNVHDGTWLGGMKQERYQLCKRAVPYFQEELKRDDLDNKLRRRIEEALEALS